MPCPLRPVVAFIAILFSVVWAARALLRSSKEEVAAYPLPPMPCDYSVSPDALTRRACMRAHVQHTT